MKCMFFGEELSAYVDGELRSARVLVIEGHLRQCKACRAQVESLRSLSRKLGMTSLPEPSLGVRSAVARRLAMTEEAPRFTCARVQTLLSARLDGELPGDQRRLLDRHLDDCRACASEWKTFESVALTVRALPEVNSPLGLERCIRAAIAREKQGLLRRWGLDGVLRPRLAPGLAAATAAVGLMFTFWLGRHFPIQPLPHHPQTAAVVYQGESTPAVVAVEPPSVPPATLRDRRDIPSPDAQTPERGLRDQPRKPAVVEVVRRAPAAPLRSSAKQETAPMLPSVTPGSFEVAVGDLTPLLSPLPKVAPPTPEPSAPAAYTPAAPVVRTAPEAPPAPEHIRIALAGLGDNQGSEANSAMAWQRGRRKDLAEQVLSPITSQQRPLYAGATIIRIPIR